jgi:hypothetical protein
MGGYYRGYAEGQPWGPYQNEQGQILVELIGTKFVPSSLSALPVESVVPNLLIDYAPVEELAVFDHSRITLDLKRRYAERYPLGPGDRKIKRTQR